jgi:hypothetical protein
MRKRRGTKMREERSITAVEGKEGSKEKERNMRRGDGSNLEWREALRLKGKKDQKRKERNMRRGDGQSERGKKN